MPMQLENLNSSYSNGQAQSANAKIVFYVMWTTYNDLYMTTTLHLIGITMFESYSYFHILAVPKHKKAH